MKAMNNTADFNAGDNEAVRVLKLDSFILTVETTFKSSELICY